MIDGEHMAERCVVVALAITADGTKIPVGLWDGSTENKTVVTRAAGRPGRPRPALRGRAAGRHRRRQGAGRRGARRCSATRPLIQRCTLHKRRNVADHLPDKDKDWVDAKLVKAFGHADPDQGLRNARELAGAARTRPTPARPPRCARAWRRCSPSPASGIDGRLAKTLTTTNPVESMISIARTTNRNVTRWRDGQMVLRWTAAGMLNAERSFRRIKGYKQMPATRRRAAPTRPPPVRRPRPPKLSVPSPRVHRGSSPKFHATRDMLSHPTHTLSQ